MVAYKQFFSSCVYNRINNRWTALFRPYSQYSPHFQEPIIQKDELDKLIQETPNKKLKTIKIKAAQSNQTCSVFYNADIAKLINYVMKDGKKELARNLVERAFTYIKHLQLRRYNKETDETKKMSILINPREVYYAAVKNCTPILTVTRIKKSGTWYNVPVGVTPKRAKFLAIHWIIEVSKEKKPKIPFSKQLAEELIAASEGHGRAFTKKVELHKLCEANRSYAHYKWT